MRELKVGKHFKWRDPNVIGEHSRFVKNKDGRAIVTFNVAHEDSYHEVGKQVYCRVESYVEEINPISISLDMICKHLK
jgi:hypothetical protein